MDRGYHEGKLFHRKKNTFQDPQVLRDMVEEATTAGRPIFKISAKRVVWNFEVHQVQFKLQGDTLIMGHLKMNVANL